MTLYLVDKSVLARVHEQSVIAALQPLIGQLAVCSTVLLEVGWSARSPAHFRQMMEDLAWYEKLDINQQNLDVAAELQARLVSRGQHRGPGVADLILAATALDHDAVVLHYDHDFDVVAEVEPRLQQHWIVPRGSV